MFSLFPLNYFSRVEADGTEQLFNRADAILQLTAIIVFIVEIILLESSSDNCQSYYMRFRSLMADRDLMYRLSLIPLELFNHLLYSLWWLVNAFEENNAIKSIIYAVHCYHVI